ncbi:hypothetical protein IAT38_002846 [Cryptococcus sp. DSM 104549]
MDPPKSTTASLHDVILDYVNTHAYASTANVLARARSAGTHDASAAGVSGSNGVGNGHGKGTVEDDEMAVDGEDGEDEGISRRRAEKMPDRGEAYDENVLDGIERRREVLDYILDGNISRAIDTLDTHFPSVLAVSPPSTSNGNTAPYHPFANPTPKPSTSWGLPSTTTNTSSTLPSAIPIPKTPDYTVPVFYTSSEPAHVRLNLQIQAFIESYRELEPSLSSPSSSASSLANSQTLPEGDPLNGAAGDRGNSSTGLVETLTAAQRMHSDAMKLPAAERAAYLKEINDVAGILAYNPLETSPLKGLLEQDRRVALAEQVNAAILRSLGKSTQSQLEMLARRTAAIYGIMADNNIDTRPPWTAADGQGKEHLAAFWKHHKGKGFRLSDFVEQTW